MNNDVNVVFITDQQYMLATVVAIRSLMAYVNDKDIYNVFVVCNNISKEEWENNILKETKKNVKFEVVNYGDALQNLFYNHSYVSKTALLKFELADLLNDLDKVLYLDGDILVCDDVKKLYSIDVDKQYAAVVKDMSVSQGEHIKRLGLKSYFNSGVMLLNLQQMRIDNCASKLFEYKEQEKSAVFMDQDAFNMIFKDRVIYLEPKYNFILDNYRKYGEEYIKKYYCVENLNNIMVKHMAGARKPWKDIESEQFLEWFQYLRDNAEIAKCILNYYEHYMPMVYEAKNNIEHIQMGCFNTNEEVNSIQKDLDEKNKLIDGIQKDLDEKNKLIDSIQKDLDEKNKLIMNIKRELEEGESLFRKMRKKIRSLLKSKKEN